MDSSVQEIGGAKPSRVLKRPNLRASEELKKGRTQKSPYCTQRAPGKKMKNEHKSQLQLVKIYVHSING